MTSVFTVRCYAKCSIAVESRLSVRLSVTLMNKLWAYVLDAYFDRDYNWVFASRRSNIFNLVHWEHPKFRMEYEWSAVLTEILHLLWNGAMTKVIVFNHFIRPIVVRVFDFCQNQWLWMILKGHYALSFRNTCIFRVHHEYLNEDIPTLSSAKCRRIVLVSDSRPKVLYGLRIFTRVLSRLSRGRQTTWLSITAVSS